MLVMTNLKNWAIWGGEFQKKKKNLKLNDKDIEAKFRQCWCRSGHHSFITFAKFSEKIIFLAPRKQETIKIQW